MVKAHDDDHRYGVVLDAGSSGTRVYVYRWLDNDVARLDKSSLRALPSLETKDKWTKKVHPGVSSFGDTPELVGTEHLQPLLDHALEYVPKHAVSDTPIFLLATAGMRLLPEQQRQDVLKNVCSYIRSETEFLLPDCDVHVQVIPGETEGLYGWIAANYLLGGFDSPEEHDHGKGHHTYGFLDMGGASAQIAFAPNATEAEKHANDLKLLRLRTVGGFEQEYRVFVTTWLGFGVNEARHRYVKGLIESYGIDGLQEMPDPCLPTGLRTTLDGDILSKHDDDDLITQRHLLGTGEFNECLRRTLPLLEKDMPCLDDPCLINGVHVPAIDFDVNHFIGISEYWHTTHEVFEMAHKDTSYDFNTYQTRVKDFCEQDWTAIQHGIEDGTWGKKVNEKTAYEVCFKASWLINMLHEGIGIPRVGLENTTTLSGHNGTDGLLDHSKEKEFVDPFQAVNKIKSTEVSWTLGKMVLYASASVPAPEGALPVGFGSNEPGIPADFQYPSGGRLQSISDPEASSGGHSLTDHIHDTLFKSDAPHRLPGFIFFLLIVIIAAFYLCGRDRRLRIFSSIFSPALPGSRGKRIRSSIFSFLDRIFRRRKEVNYDRVAEDGNERLYDPDDFELGDIDSDDSEASKLKDRGWSSPKRNSRPGRGGSLSPDVMDRQGLVVRTESRQNLDLGIGRPKSRNGSPPRVMKGSPLLDN